jgi:hypothetical protein
MKLNLGCGDDIRLQDTMNIDILPNPNAPPQLYRQGDVTSLDWICAPGQADEIMANNVLPCLSYEIIDSVLEHWVSRLKKGGILKIAVPDLRWIARSLVEDTIDLPRAMTLLYGPQNHEYSGFRSGYDLKVLCDRLISMGMKITIQRQMSFLAYIEAEKTEGE